MSSCVKGAHCIEHRMQADHTLGSDRDVGWIAMLAGLRIDWIATLAGL